jgi:hypothetical protein
MVELERPKEIVQWSYQLKRQPRLSIFLQSFQERSDKANDYRLPFHRAV